MEMYKEIRRQAEQDMKKLLEALNKEVKLGRLPDVEVEPVWKDGIPEDEIYRYGQRPIVRHSSSWVPVERAARKAI